MVFKWYNTWESKVCLQCSISIGTSRSNTKTGPSKTAKTWSHLVFGKQCECCLFSVRIPLVISWNSSRDRERPAEVGLGTRTRALAAV